MFGLGAHGPCHCHGTARRLAAQRMPRRAYASGSPRTATQPLLPHQGLLASGVRALPPPSRSLAVPSPPPPCAAYYHRQSRPRPSLSLIIRTVTVFLFTWNHRLVQATPTTKKKKPHRVSKTVLVVSLYVCSSDGRGMSVDCAAAGHCTGDLVFARSLLSRAALVPR